MKKHAKKLLQNPLIYGSSILVFGSLFSNFFNFLFNLYMTRNLSNADYGVLASTISLITLPALMTGAIVPMVVQFAGNFYAQQQLHLVKGFYYQMKKYFFIVAIAILLLMLITIPISGNFLHIHDVPLLVMTSCIVCFGILQIINIAFIQAKMGFSSIVGINIVSAFVKLVIGVGLVFIGYKVTGAIGAILVSTIVGYILSFFPIKFVFSPKDYGSAVNTKQLFKYGLTSTLTLIGLTSFITADIILVKHFFDPNTAGIYAAIILIGKVIFYLVSPIGNVMFSIVVQKYSNKETIVPTFLQSLFLVLLPSILLTMMYHLFPEPVIMFFTKKTANLVVSPLLGLTGLYMTSYVILYIVANFYLSINKTKIAYPLLTGAAAQIVAILLFHATIFQIIISSLIITAILNTFLLLYFFQIIHKR